MAQTRSQRDSQLYLSSLLAGNLNLDKEHLEKVNPQSDSEVLASLLRDRKLDFPNGQFLSGLQTIFEKWQYGLY